MSLVIPGRILARTTGTTNGTTNVDVLLSTGYSALLTTVDRKKCNAVLINYPNAVADVGAGIASLFITLDGTTTSSTTPVGLDIGREKTVLIYGQPTIKMIGGTGFTSTTSILEVYLLYVPGANF